MKYNTVILVLLLVTLVVLTGCYRTVDELTVSDEYVGEIVVVRGVAQDVTKIGDLSGYVLEDKNGDEIIVATKNLPVEGEQVIARGIVRKGPLNMGYYIDTN